MSALLAKFKDAAKSVGLEAEFLKAAGLSSLDELSPENFRDVDSESPIPKLQSKAAPSAEASAPPTVHKSVADPAPGPSTPSASDLLFPFLATSITRVNRKSRSTYVPCSIMMFYILHQINELLCDNFYFKRSTPDYHPYILRLYFGILFYVQVLRAWSSQVSPNDEYHDFLTRFLETHRPETLAIPGPLLSLFKTLSASQPEFSNYGKVYPVLPQPLGPATRARLYNTTAPGIAGLPAVPGIFALLSALNSKINGTTPSYPKKGYVPVEDSTTDDFPFQGYTYPHHTAATGTAAKVNNWSDTNAWYLMFPGLEYGCEASKSMNEAFAERYEEYEFPATAGTDVLTTIGAFLGNPQSGDWFNKVKEVAAAASIYFEGSGTLADCSPSGVQSNQVVVRYQAPPTLPTKPWKMADPYSRFPLAYRLSTSSRSLPQMFEVMAAAGQTHARGFATHPYTLFQRIGVGAAGNRVGPFWEIRPIDQSPVDDSSYLSIRHSVKSALKSKV